MRTLQKNALVVASSHLPQTSSLDLLAAIPEEELWLAGQRSEQTRRAYRQDVAHFLDNQIRLVISSDHWTPRADWTKYRPNGGPEGPNNPKWEKFVHDCYGELMPRYDHWPHVIAWYNWDETHQTWADWGYDASVATGITRPVHSLFIGRPEELEKENAANAKGDILHCDYYTNSTKHLKNWMKWSRGHFPDLTVWVTLSAHWAWNSTMLEEKAQRMRQQGILCYGLGVDGMFYWSYLPESTSRYGTIAPGPLGPITSCRWESVRETTIDLEYLANIDYLMKRYHNVLPERLAKDVQQRRDQAVEAEEAMQFHRCRRELSAAWTELVRACKLEGRVAPPEPIE